METLLQVTFRNINRSEALEAKIRERTERLERHFDRIIGCRVAVEEVSTRHRKGSHFQVRIDVTVPGTELVAGHDRQEHHAYTDVYVALRDAFDAVDRQLQDYVQRQEGRSLARDAAPPQRSTGPRRRKL